MKMKEKAGVFKKILIVDDSKLIHNICRVMLVRYGDFNILNAMNGIEALISWQKKGRLTL